MLKQQANTPTVSEHHILKSMKTTISDVCQETRGFRVDLPIEFDPILDSSLPGLDVYVKQPNNGDAKDIKIQRTASGGSKEHHLCDLLQGQLRV
jgi:hypothetical protein